MFDDSRPTRQHVGVALQDVVRVLAFQAIEQRRESMHVIEVLEQAEPIRLREVCVRLLLRQRGGHLDRDLFVADRRLDAANGRRRAAS